MTLWDFEVCRDLDDSGLRRETLQTIKAYDLESAEREAAYIGYTVKYTEGSDTIVVE